MTAAELSEVEDRWEAGVGGQVHGGGGETPVLVPTSSPAGRVET